MQNHEKTVLAGGFILIIIFGAFLFLKMRPSPEVKVVKQDSTSQSSPDENKTTAVPKEDSFASCIAKEKSSIEKKQVKYKKGSILVAFQSKVTFEEAKLVIEKNSNDIEYQYREGLESGFETSPWLEVRTRDGEELKWVCLLKADPKVKAAVVNSLLDLHE